MIRLFINRYLTTECLRECAAASVSLAAPIAGVKAIYDVDVNAVNGLGWLYDESDWLYLAANGARLFSVPGWDLHSLVWLGASLLLFSAGSVALLAIGTCLLSGYIHGGTAWTAAKARALETVTAALPARERFREPATAVRSVPPEGKPGA
ncbi:hypothetical protein PQR66_27615 [Paraburkholderia agricolaris]|uniref:Uncharacterized protein n=1 Tax=Paraburkholderia agricolaris TaxID=2152888 RepID=A0ABW8ZVH5_9BURK